LPALQAQVPATALALSHSNANGVFVEWALPVGAQSAEPSVVGSSEPLHVLPTFDDAGNLFFTQRNLGYIGSLNTRSQITEWSLGAGSFPHDMTLVGETIILTEEGTNAIGQFNSEKNTIKEWPVPTSFAEPWHEARVGSNLYFSEVNAQKVARLNLVTNQITEWPTPNIFPEGLDAATGTKVWFVEASAGKIAVLNTLTNTITEYPLSGAAVSTALSHLKIFEGKIFVTDQGTTSNYLAELDPSTNTVFEWLVPTANAATGDLVVTETEFFGGGNSHCDT
jgi:streptogramin lyase